jgi:ABC-type phosphate transport system substrate-binding protein
VIKRAFSVVCTWSALVALIGAESAVLTIAAPPATLPFLQGLVQRYETEFPGQRVLIRETSDAGDELRQGKAALGVSEGVLSESAREAFHCSRIARNGLVIIVNAKNRVRELSKAQALAIWSGGFTTWTDLAGEGAISCISKPANDANLARFCAYFSIQASGLHPHIIIGDDQHALRVVAENTAAIAFVTLAAAQVAIRNEAAIHLVALGNVAANSETIRAGLYPIVWDLNIMTGKPVDTRCAAFLRFVGEQQEWMSDNGFVTMP